MGDIWNSEYRRVELPYCFAKLTPAEPIYMFGELCKHIWLPINRRYKPLGMTTRDWVDYEDHFDRALVFARDPCTFKDIWNRGEPDPGAKMLHLYNDGMRDWAVYTARLARLLSHSHRYCCKPPGPWLSQPGPFAHLIMRRTGE